MKALALFGSQVSGGANKNSDKDFLVVCSSDKKRSYIRHYSKRGYSVSAYTPTQLDFMRSKGSLFLQHLKIESHILYDRDYKLHTFLNNCQLVKPSDNELNNCRDSLQNTMYSPKDHSLYGWLADCLYVFSRDYFVKYFAQDGRLIFNVNQLCESIKIKFKLDLSDSNILLMLREEKNLYRNNTAYFPKRWDLLERWIEILNNIIFDNSLTLQNNHTNDSYLNMHHTYIFNSSYELLRYIESLRLLFPAIRCGNKKELLVNKLITRPNNYSSTSKHSRIFLDNYLLDFTSMATKSLQLTNQYAAPFYSALYCPLAEIRR